MQRREKVLADLCVAGSYALHAAKQETRDRLYLLVCVCVLSAVISSVKRVRFAHGRMLSL